MYGGCKENGFIVKGGIIGGYMDRELVDKFKNKVATETLDLFQEVEGLFAARDFYLERIGDWYAVKFTSTLGYLPCWKYEPLVRYSFHHKAWETKIGTARFFTSGCPFFELICELRGYTLPMTVTAEDVVLDAGPWNGISGMYFSSVVKKGKVIFLEPDEDSADYLEGQIKTNGFLNAQIVRKALYSRDGEISFQRRPLGASSITESAGDGAVESITLQKLISEHAPQGIDYFKMDIEGAEVDVAEDLAKYISENSKSWAAIASYHKIAGEKSYVHLEKCFARYPDLIFKTAYPYHQTTFVANVKNETAVKAIKRVTDFKVGWKAVQRDLKRRGIE